MLRAGQSVSVRNPCPSPNRCNLFFLTHAGHSAQNALFFSYQLVNSYSLVKAPDSVPLSCPQASATTWGTLTAHSQALGMA